ncbi:MAG: STAS domain-containing protein [Candidatus Omnitrophica bacterium]|nr:STAS domain-containing protein [Candidatus Omnitrophota bacterium]
MEGDINLHAAPGIKKAFAELINQKPPRLIVNFSKVNYIDSSGLGILVELLKRVKVYGGSLKLTNLSPMIKSMFEIMKLDKIFDILSDEEGAIAAFK